MGGKPLESKKGVKLKKTKRQRKESGPRAAEGGLGTKRRKCVRKGARARGGEAAGREWETERHPGGAEAVIRRVIRGRWPGSANGSGRARQTSRPAAANRRGGSILSFICTPYTSFGALSK